MLGREELAQYGGWGHRRIFGLSLLLFPGPAGTGPEAGVQLRRVAGPGGLKRPPVDARAGKAVELFTWSPEVRSLVPSGE